MTSARSIGRGEPGPTGTSISLAGPSNRTRTDLPSGERSEPLPSARRTGSPPSIRRRYTAPCGPAVPPRSLMTSVRPSAERPPRKESSKTERSRSVGSAEPRAMTPPRSVLRCKRARPSGEISRRLSTPAER